MVSIAGHAFVIIVYACSLVTSQAPVSLCVTKLPSRQAFLYSFLNPSNEKNIPEEYVQYVNNETDCIIFMDLNLTDDVALQIYPFRFTRSPVPPSIRIILVNDNLQPIPDMQILAIEHLTSVKFEGNSTSSFAIIYSKRTAAHSPFILQFKTKKVRKSDCPDLENAFSLITCSNGNEVGSNCTFQCPERFYPSPDLFNPNTESETIRRFQSSRNREFVSTCTLSERQRPAWKPDGITPQPSLFGTEWEDEPIQWKCVPLNVVKDVCLADTSLPKLIQVIHFGRSAFMPLVSEYVSVHDCYYPPEFLLSIFGEEKNEELGTITTPPPPTLATSTTEFRGMVPPGEPGRTPTDSIVDPSLNTLDCSTYCKFDSSVGSFSPPCGNYETVVTQIDCLTCRYTGAASACGQLDVVS